MNLKPISRQLLAILLVVFMIHTSAEAQEWSQFRGHKAMGIAENANLPDTWDLKTGDNVKWKIDIPGLGLSCPVIWDDKLFITTAVSEDDNSGFKTGYFGNVDPVNDTSYHEWKVYCFDKNTGKKL